MQYTKRILVTGASGFVGRNLLQYLGKKGKIGVRVFVHKKDVDMKPPVIEKVQGDIRYYNSLEKAFLGEPLDAVVHLAAVIKSPKQGDFDEVNVEGTKNLVRLAEIYEVKKFIFPSSDFILYEDVAPNPYGISKRKCEEIITASNLDFTIFRPTPIFGSGDTKNFASLTSLIKKYPIVPAVHCLMEPVYVGDVAKMIVAALENPLASRQIYYLPGGAKYSFPDILSIIAKHLRLKRLIIPLPPQIFLLALKIYENLFHNPLLESYQVKKWLKTQPLEVLKTKKDLGYNPIAFEEGVRFIDL